MTALVTGAIGLCAAAVIIFLLRRDRLRSNHAVVWLFVAAGFSLLGLAPGIVDEVAGAIGIAYPPVLAIILALIAVIIKLLTLDIELSHLQIRYKRVVQRMALLEAELEQMQDRKAEATQHEADD
ncbi:DUF2304 domain-containing protein [Halioglobus maricola]|uniref:DUF2304 domain-containing protein n=1 Tax=Halioglobus maricola TaxID=2601894 RepID=A0A5P9NH10_9GAMM|nr:DUF2304 domain-containing protein [Halioglobus maricola]QFU74318.1 DUF2304 domain-containing protein [Halioglobus maricola]